MEDVAGELSSVIGPLRRRLLRTTRKAAGLPELQDATVELLRVIDHAGTSTVAEAANQLNTATSTVSNLLRSLIRDELVDRRTDETDRRIARITLTAQAREWLHRYDEASRQLVNQAMSHMSQDHQEQLEKAIPALRALQQALREEDDAASRPSDGAL